MVGICLLLPVLARAQLRTPDGFSYYVNRGPSVTVYAYNGPDSDIVIPDTIEGLPVTQIASGFYFPVPIIDRLTIPATVTNLGDGAFTGPYILVTVLFLGNAPTYNYKNSPFYPYQTTDIRHLPGTSGWGSSYSGCNAGLWDPSMPCEYSTNNGIATITQYWGTNTQIILPGNFSGVPLGILGPYTFRGHDEVTNIVIPDSVTQIGSGAFVGCSIPTISLGTNIQTIGPSAFAGCAYLQSIAIPDKVSFITNGTFSGCTSLTNIQFGKNVHTIRIDAFANCDGLTEIYIPGTITNINSMAFAFCANLRRVTFGEGFINARLTPFYNCDNLTSIILPDTINNISTNGFNVCPALSGLYFTGDAPTITNDLSAIDVTVYYLPGTTGWDTTWHGRPTAVWQPRLRTEDENFGFTPNGFGFNIDWAPQQTIIVEACDDLSAPDWQPRATNTLGNNLFYYCDPTSTNVPTRYYRVKSE